MFDNILKTGIFCVTLRMFQLRISQNNAHKYLFLISGIDLLRRRIEKEILHSTGRMHIRMRVKSGTEAFAWLYKELTVTHTEPDPQNSQYMFIDVIATETQIFKFKRFLKE